MFTFTFCMLFVNILDLFVLTEKLTELVQRVTTSWIRKGFESRKGQEIFSSPKPSRPALEPTLPLLNGYPGYFKNYILL
jgi:hypothetical protein